MAAHLLDPPRHPSPFRLPPPKAIEAAPSAWTEAAHAESLVDVCASIALRDLNLIDLLLSELEEMERTESDSSRLDDLYRLDHLATRLRRNAENLRVLADRDADEGDGGVTSVLDTVRAAMSSIDQYTRIAIGSIVPLGVVGLAADDVSRVLAELLDNAANHSPATAQVRVSAHLTEQGSVLIRIEDEGIGLPNDRLAEVNRRLAGAMPLDDNAVRHMGLAVVGRLAKRHDLKVSLQRRKPNGLSAIVLVPTALVTDLDEESWSGAKTVPPVGRNQGRRSVPAEPIDRPARAPRAEPRPSVAEGRTASGLPRRVSRSIKDEPPPPPPVDTEADDEAGPPSGSEAHEGQERFLAALSDFTAGAQAARAENGETR